MPVYTFTTFDDPSASIPFTLALGLNGMGQIVGAYINSSMGHGFLLSGGTYTTLDDPLGANGTEAWGINGAGQIVGDYRDASNGFHGFLYTGGIYITLDDPSATQGVGNGTEAFGINASSQIVGVYGAPARLPLQPQRQHLHHHRRSLGHQRHPCAGDQRRRSDRRVV